MTSMPRRPPSNPEDEKMERSRERLRLLEEAHLKAKTPEERLRLRGLVEMQERSVRMRERGVLKSENRDKAHEYADMRQPDLTTAQKRRVRIERAFAVGVLGGSAVGLAISSYLWPTPYELRQHDLAGGGIMLLCDLTIGFITYYVWR